MRARRPASHQAGSLRFSVDPVAMSVTEPGHCVVPLPPVRNKARKWVVAALERDLGVAVAPDELLPSPATLVSKTRDGAKVTKKYDRPTTPHQRADRHAEVSAEDKAIMKDVHAGLIPAAIQRQLQALTAELLTLTTSKAAAARRPGVQGNTKRAFRVSQRRWRRAS